jgi:hypothetical protein
MPCSAASAGLQVNQNGIALFRWMYFFCAWPILWVMVNYANNKIFAFVEWLFYRDAITYLDRWAACTLPRANRRCQQLHLHTAVGDVDAVQYPQFACIHTASIKVSVAYNKRSRGALEHCCQQLCPGHCQGSGKHCLHYVQLALPVDGHLSPPCVQIGTVPLPAGG